MSLILCHLPISSNVGESASIPAPIVVDSDSDFAPGAFVVVESKPKKKRKRAVAGPCRVSGGPTKRGAPTKKGDSSLQASTAS